MRSAKTRRYSLAASLLFSFTRLCTLLSVLNIKCGFMSALSALYSDFINFTSDWCAFSFFRNMCKIRALMATPKTAKKAATHKVTNHHVAQKGRITYNEKLIGLLKSLEILFALSFIR